MRRGAIATTLLALAGVGAALALNISLLGLSGRDDDPVGRLRPVASLPPTGQTTATVTAPTVRVDTSSTDHDDDHEGDDGGRDRDDDD